MSNTQSTENDDRNQSTIRNLGLYSGPLVYELPDGSLAQILVLPAYPRRPSGKGKQLILTPILAERIIRAARAGNPTSICCTLAGVSYDALKKWRASAGEDPKSEEPESPHAKALRRYLLAFVEGLDRAHALAQGDALALIRSAASSSRVTTKTSTRKTTFADGSLRIEELSEQIIAPPDIKLSIWILEHIYPEEFGLRREVDDADQGLSEESETNSLLRMIRDSAARMTSEIETTGVE